MGTCHKMNESQFQQLLSTYHDYIYMKYQQKQIYRGENRSSGHQGAGSGISWGNFSEWQECSITDDNGNIIL